MPLSVVIVVTIQFKCIYAKLVNPLLNAQEERTLAKRIVDGDEEARNLLARANLRLVVSIAKNMLTFSRPNFA